MIGFTLCIVYNISALCISYNYIDSLQNLEFKIKNVKLYIETMSNLDICTLYNLEMYITIMQNFDIDIHTPYNMFWTLH